MSRYFVGERWRRVYRAVSPTISKSLSANLKVGAPFRHVPDQPAEKRFAAGNHPVRRLTDTPPESGGEFVNGSPPQMRRGGAMGGGVVLIRVSADSF